MWLPYVQVSEIGAAPSARRSERRCCSSRARGRRAGAPSCPRRPAVRSRSGSRRSGPRERAALLQRPATATRRVRAPARAIPRELHAHCYRMLGSVHDAEDALQEALLRAWRGLAVSRAAARCARGCTGSPRTPACGRSSAARSGVLPIDYGPPADPHDGWPRAAESVGSSRIPMTRTAGARRRRATSSARASSWRSSRRCSTSRASQRAVLILRDVLGFSAREVADTLDTSPASVDSAAAARARVRRQRLPAQSQQATLRALGDERR